MKNRSKIKAISTTLVLLAMVSCSHTKVDESNSDGAVKFDRGIMKEAVVYEPGTKEGAVLPDVSAPRLKAIWVPEKVEGNRLVEAHREWLLDGNVTLLGIPKPAVTLPKGGVK